VVRKRLILIAAGVLTFLNTEGIRRTLAQSDKSDERRVGTKYIVWAKRSTQNGFGGTRFDKLGSKGFGMVEIPDGGNWRDSGCYFIRRLGNNRVIISGSPNATFGYTFDEQTKTIVSSKTAEASEWILEPAPREKGGHYLKVAHGKLSGWYLDFEEKEERYEVSFGTESGIAKFWRVKLSEKPGRMSNLDFQDTPFKKTK
jgi:hypothetical protein